MRIIHITLIQSIHFSIQYLIVQIRNILENISYYCHYMNAGLGNNLLSYWFSSGLAFFFNLHYKSFLNFKDIHTFNTSQYINVELMINDGKKVNN